MLSEGAPCTVCGRGCLWGSRHVKCAEAARRITGANDGLDGVLELRAEVERLREAVDGIGGLTGTWVQEVGGRFVVRFSFEGETSFETAEQAHEAGREYMRIVAEIVAGDRNKPAPGWTVEGVGGDGQATMWAAHRATFPIGVYDTEAEAVAHTWKSRHLLEVERLRAGIHDLRHGLVRDLRPGDGTEPEPMVEVSSVVCCLDALAREDGGQ